MPIPSRRVPLGTRLPWFSVTDLQERPLDTSTLQVGRPTLVAFLCNHSPYVQHIERHLGPVLSRLHTSAAVTVVGISPNDVTAYPTDDLAMMRAQAKRAEFAFPYCLDATQQAAKAFGATCTPEFFLYDIDWRLVYHGQYDGSRPGNDLPVTGDDLLSAIAATCEDDVVSAEQSGSFGCSVKWRPGNEPSYVFALS